MDIDQFIDIDDDSNTQHSIGAGVSSSSNHAITTANIPTTSRSNQINTNSRSNTAANLYYNDQDLEMASDHSDSSEYSDWAEEDGRKTLKPPPRTKKQRTTKTQSKRTLRVHDDDEEEQTNQIDIDEATNHSFDSTPKTKKSTSLSKKLKKIVSDDDDDEYSNSKGATKIKSDESDAQEEDEEEENEDDDDEYEDDDDYSTGVEDNQDGDKPCTSSAAISRSTKRKNKRKLKSKSQLSYQLLYNILAH